MACPIAGTCTFFNNQLRMMEERKKIIKITFCLSGFTQCARYKVYEHFKSEHKVPPNLYPNNFDHAHELIGLGKKHRKFY
ncbi:MAG: hypothetical protein KJ915_02010 [Candidatus Omnitrophica bacterium]|nr:hypothetical protein [Candidatus Omnitrophota bacterium]